MAINYNNCLKAARGGVACKSLLQLAKQAGVELPESYRHAFNLHTGFEAIKSLRPKRPKGQTAKNGQKAEKIANNGFLAKEWPNGHLAFLAFREGYTFSDKIAPTYWSSFCRGILDSQTDTVGCDTMMLGIPNNISGLPRRSYFSIRSGFASKKGGATSYPASSCCAPSSPCGKMSSQRMASHGNASAPTAHVVIL